MRIHILGICGTFMGGIAHILKDSGHHISGSDTQFYPPMSDQLQDSGIELISGYEASSLPDADLYIIGNALSRGNESIEFILENKLPFKSGPEILGEMLAKKNVIAVSGTHGKTTTSYMLCHIFLSQGRDIGYLVGGISSSTDKSAYLGSDPIFIVEADEYDSAFFDKRSKFIHYKPSTLVINNIEFDHADIFRDIEDIKKQFHHLIKTIPSSGNIIFYNDNENISDVIGRGIWSNKVSINNGNINLDLQNKYLKILDKEFYLGDLPLIGDHNLQNYSSAILGAYKNGISVEASIASLMNFKGVKRRLELKGEYNNVKIFDDFAHHPTAIKYTADALHNHFKDKKIFAIVELGSNTMSGGFHGDDIFKASKALAKTIWIDHKDSVMNESYKNEIFDSLDGAIKFTKSCIEQYDIILIMTNKDSSKIYNPLIAHLEKN